MSNLDRTIKKLGDNSLSDAHHYFLMLSAVPNLIAAVKIMREALIFYGPKGNIILNELDQGEVAQNAIDRVERLFE